MTKDYRAIIHEFILSRRDEQVEFLRKLVRIPTDNPPGDTVRHSRIAGELLEGLGFEVERHPVPESLVRDTGMISATNLVVRRSFDGGPVVALNAHGDVVPPGEGWTTDPYGAEIRDNDMFGRGVAVSKSDFATYTYALLALEAAGAPLKGSVELHFTYDEEVGGTIGPKWLLDEGISRPDFAIAAGFSYGVVTAHSGCLHLEVKVKGRQAHAALPHAGRDALEAANGVLDAIYGHRKGYRGIRSSIEGIGSPSVVVGLIEGGISTNVVPCLVRMQLDRRFIPEENGAEVEKSLTMLIGDAVSRFPGISCDIRRTLLAEPLAPVPGSEQLTNILLANGREIMGEAIPPHGVPLYTDARHYAAAGIPTVLYGAGPRSILDANAHGTDEHLWTSRIFVKRRR